MFVFKPPPRESFQIQIKGKHLPPCYPDPSMHDCYVRNQSVRWTLNQNMKHAKLVHNRTIFNTSNDVVRLYNIPIEFAGNFFTGWNVYCTIRNPHFTYPSIDFRKDMMEESLMHSYNQHHHHVHHQQYPHHHQQQQMHNPVHKMMSRDCRSDLEFSAMMLDDMTARLQTMVKNEPPFPQHYLGNPAFDHPNNRLHHPIPPVWPRIWYGVSIFPG